MQDAIFSSRLQIKQIQQQIEKEYHKSENVKEGDPPRRASRNDGEQSCALARTKTCNKLLMIIK
jgi:hypothetical protein